MRTVLPLLLLLGVLMSLCKAAEVDGADYRKEVNAAVGARWNAKLKDHRETAGEGIVVVDYEISVDGRIRVVKAESKDGAGPLLTRLCRESVEEAKIAAPPEQLSRRHGGPVPGSITFTHSFARNEIREQGTEPEPQEVSEYNKGVKDVLLREFERRVQKVLETDAKAIEVKVAFSISPKGTPRILSIRASSLNPPDAYIDLCRTLIKQVELPKPPKAAISAGGGEDYIAIVAFPFPSAP